VFLTVLLSGCNPSSTPFSTATATSIIYNVEIIVVDENGKPIHQAEIIQGNSVEFTDAQGVWKNSSQSPKLSIDVWTLRYLSQKYSTTLQSGDNKVQIQLLINPYVLRVADSTQNKYKMWTSINPYCLCPGGSIDTPPGSSPHTPLDPCPPPPENPCPED
jgi:hypothetical protein